MRASSPAPWLMLVSALAGAGSDADAQPATPEARAVAYLAGEVPRWSRANHCYSCHNNGDAARALYQAARAGIPVRAGAMTDTTTWLSRPARWDHNGGDGPFSDKRLARVVFTATLATAVQTEAIRDRGVLLRAAERLALDQAGDGSWPLEGEEAPGSPVAYGRLLATYPARARLAAAQPVPWRAAIARRCLTVGSRDRDRDGRRSRPPGRRRGGLDGRPRTASPDPGGRVARRECGGSPGAGSSEGNEP